jgi:predicted GH43/DUF377 family glycosyl hydrolase
LATENPWSGGGCEDARVTYLQPLDLYVMAYTAYTLLGPRVALAISNNLLSCRHERYRPLGTMCSIQFTAASRPRARRSLLTQAGQR